VYVPKLKSHVRKWDVFALVPQWNFFAPRPAQHDYVLLYRDQLKDGTMTDWAQVATIPPRPIWSMIWNPRKRDNKALFDIATDLAAHIRRSVAAVELSVPYITILSYISEIPRFGPTGLTQFLLMRSQVTSESTNHEILFLSRLHSL
jgi:hypothetical protein